MFKTDHERVPSSGLSKISVKRCLKQVINRLLLIVYQKDMLRDFKNRS